MIHIHRSYIAPLTCAPKQPLSVASVAQGSGVNGDMKQPHHLGNDNKKIHPMGILYDIWIPYEMLQFCACSMGSDIFPLGQYVVTLGERKNPLGWAHSWIAAYLGQREIL